MKKIRELSELIAKRAGLDQEILKAQEGVMLAGGRRMAIGYQAQCAVGATVTITRQPQLVFCARSLVVSRMTAKDFELVDIQVGRNSAFINHDPIPLDAFGVDLDGYTDALKLEFCDMKPAPMIDVDICQISQTLALVVRRIFDCRGPRDPDRGFGGTLVGFVPGDGARQ